MRWLSAEVLVGPLVGSIRMARSEPRPADLESLLEQHHRRADGLLAEFTLIDDAIRRAPTDPRDLEDLLARIQGLESPEI